RLPQLQGKLVGEIHGTVAIDVCGLGRLLQEGDDCVARAVERVSLIARFFRTGGERDTFARHVLARDILALLFRLGRKRDVFLGAEAEWNDLLHSLARTLAHVGGLRSTGTSKPSICLRGSPLSVYRAKKSSALWRAGH